MARLPRYYIKNQPQHVIQRGIDQQEIFFQEQDYQYYYDCLEAAAYNNNLKIHAYVLMPDHVHLLASPGNNDSISRTLQSLGRNYVQYYNECYGHSGTLWEGRYRATIIDSKHYLLPCSRVIETNPVRAGLVKTPKDYVWSSYQRNAYAKKNELITEHRIYSQLSATDKAKASAYRALFKKPVSEQELDTIMQATNKGWALGDSKFASKIEKLGGRRATPLPKGRPKLSKA